MTEKGKAFARNQRIRECFVEAGLQALLSQLWSIHWISCWPSDPQVKGVWITKEQVNDKCIEVKDKWPLSVPDEMQVLAE